jgi:tRNA 2-selenouridine synthase
LTGGAFPARVSFDSLADALCHGFDTLIDVRSPSEFAEDHMPGAINLPVLSDAERAQVGTIYKQDSPFRARKIGAALVARNAAAHLEGPLAGQGGGWRPLVHCWRGGQRSGSFALILAQVGWRVGTVAGGYQTWRRLVHAALYEVPLPHRFILLDGDTGTAKTALLARVAAAGGQVIDLEGLAGHRGSLLGATAAGQPGQKAFETALAATLARLDPARPVLVEAESSRIGRLTVPPQVWAAMQAAPRVVLTAPVAARATWLAQAYADLVAEPDRLAALLDALRPLRGHQAVEAWQALLAARDWPGLAGALIEGHYDAAYARARRGAGADAVIALDDLGEAALAQATGRLMALLDRPTLIPA